MKILGLIVLSAPRVKECVNDLFVSHCHQEQLSSKHCDRQCNIMNQKSDWSLNMRKTTLVLGLCVFLLLNSTHANPFIIVGVFSNVLAAIVTIADHAEKCSVTVENQGRHHAHLWCASKDDRIGGQDGIWVPPGQSLGWTFRKKGSTQFWCTMDWYGRRYGWDVFVANWGGHHGRWVIKDDGVYEKGGKKQMYIESNIVV